MTRDYKITDDNIHDLSMKRNEKEIKQCMETSKKIDRIIINSVDKGIDPKLVAGVLADALGRFLDRFDGKEKLWEVLEKTIKKKSGVG